MWLYRSLVDQQAHANAGLFGETCTLLDTHVQRWSVLLCMQNHAIPAAGPIIITRAAAADADAKPKDVDREFITLFQVRGVRQRMMRRVLLADPEVTITTGLMLQIVDEGASPFTEISAKRFGGPDGQNGIADPDDFSESQLKHSINGAPACAAIQHSQPALQTERAR